MFISINETELRWLAKSAGGHAPARPAPRSPAWAVRVGPDGGAAVERPGGKTAR